MEIPKVNEINKPSAAQEAVKVKLGCRECLYLDGKACKLPQLMYSICRSCPKAAQYIKANVVTNIFAKIKGLAILLMGKMGENKGISN